jgi:hypothetical protein
VGREVAGKGCKRVNMLQTLVCMYVNGKAIPVKTIPGM